MTIESRFQVERTYHEYDVVRMWEQDPAIFLADLALLPLAPLAASDNYESLLSEIAKQISKIESQEQKREINTCTQILAGLKFEQSVIRQFLREGIMRESVIYQEILQEGVQQGLQQGVQQGVQQGLQQGEQTIVMRLLERRFGNLPAQLKEQVANLASPQLEELADVLLGFSEIADLESWLQSRSA